MSRERARLLVVTRLELHERKYADTDTAIRRHTAAKEAGAA